MSHVSPGIQKNLNNQGFDGLDAEAKAQCATPLRFTPAVGTVLVLAGLVSQSPALLATMAVAALSGALLPSGMLIDLVYNLGVRHLTHARKLPPTPMPRRFSYLLSTALLTASAIALSAGLTTIGFISGGIVALGGAILATTHWCLGSWFYRAMFGLPTP